MSVTFEYPLSKLDINIHQYSQGIYKAPSPKYYEYWSTPMLKLWNSINNKHRHHQEAAVLVTSVRTQEVVQCSQPSLDCVSCCCCAVAGAAMRGCLAQPPHPGSSTASPGPPLITISQSARISSHLSVPPPIAASHCTISAYRHSAAVVEMYNR